MAAIDQYLRQILVATYGEDVRQSIHNAILQIYVNASESVAQTYSNLLTYNVGDYAIYDGVLYSCISKIATAEEWTPSHWIEAKIGDDISALFKIIADDYEQTNTKLEELFNAIDAYGPQEETASEIAREILKSGAYFKSMADATDTVKEDE